MELILARQLDKYISQILDTDDHIQRMGSDVDRSLETSSFNGASFD
jgi:hypothetical protein